MKKYNLHFLFSLLLLTSFLISCEKGSKPNTNEAPPKTEDTTAIVKDTTDSKDTVQISKAAASIIIDDLKILLKWGTGMNNCDCNVGAWSASTALTTTTANVGLPSFNLSGVNPRAIVLCEVTFPNVETKGMCKLSFDKGCSSLKFRNCTSSNITADRKNVRIAKSTASINLKPEYDMANTGRFILTPTNCNGCKFRFKRCTGNWQWGDCTSSLNNN